MLDKQGLYKLFSRDKNGNLLYPVAEITRVPTAPRCHCGAVVTTGRFAIIEQLRNVTITFDKLLAKMGRKMNMFADRICQQENVLAETFIIFCHNIRPNPMTAFSNKQSLFARGKPLDDVRDAVGNFRDEVVRPFERSMAALHKMFPALTPKYMLLFRPRFDLLAVRARSVWIQDSLRSARFLAALKDGSYEVQRLANLLRENAIVECVRYIAYCEERIKAMTSAPCLEVEFRIAQLSLRHLAECAMVEELSVKSTHLGASPTMNSDVSTTYAKMSKDGFAPRHAVDFVLKKEAAEHSHEVVNTICKQYPDTAGRFLAVATALRNQQRTADPTELPKIYTTRASERAWGNHVVGQLRQCEKGHAYSGGSFPEGCPECGRKYELPEEEFTKSAQFLHEDDFLAKMKAMKSCK